MLSKPIAGWKTDPKHAGSKGVKASRGRGGAVGPMTHVRRIVGIAFTAVLLSGCGVNTLPTLDEKVKSSWAQVENQYQRRADLIPNLVETVKGYAKQDSSPPMNGSGAPSGRHCEAYTSAKRAYASGQPSVHGT